MKTERDIASEPQQSQAERDIVSRSISRVRLAGVGIVAGVLGVVATIVVAASAANSLPSGAVDIGTVAAVVVVATLVGLALGVRYRKQWLSPALVAGVLVGVFLFLRGAAFLVEGRVISYPLLFGLPGAAVAIGVTLVAAWVGSRPRVARGLSPSQLSPLARGGLVVAGGWTVIQLLFGLGLAATAGYVLNNTFAGTLIATVVGFPVATLFAVQYGRRVGIDRDDWDYRTTVHTVGIGLTGGLLTVLAVQGVGLLVTSVAGTDAAVTTFGFLLADLEAGVWVLALFALAHGIVAPVTEELAWRGVVQTALVESWGPTVGIAVTAVLFTAKHVVLDASLARLPTVLVLAVALGLVRHRWGATASTVVHAVVNLTSVATLAILVFG
ncbi:CPBP family intramembrane glutamic endopeptidase [Halobellus sp. Atlit-38R]|uniref:CPBP family intramembrane glutamic endopeptidase n=1 Tax=Halobellus sp. Atlit-38R TaxID=2282131 RepID=UPI0013144D19|nr:CPBP family intramembrane glutamic endopeptidase [Halobellus sp. Atlit-38R]